MRIAMFSTKPYDRRGFEAAPGAAPHEMLFLEPRLAPLTAPLAIGDRVYVIGHGGVNLAQGQFQPVVVPGNHAGNVFQSQLPRF